VRDRQLYDYVDRGARVRGVFARVRSWSPRPGSSEDQSA
jgi:hypothetical protein